MTKRVLTYLTLDGAIVNLSGLSDVERGFFERCYQTYADGSEYEAFLSLVYGPDNPTFETGQRITRATLDHPLFRAVDDLGDRLGIKQGEVGAAPGDDIGSDPLSDESLTIKESAQVAGVTVAAVYKAIDRGDLAATDERPARVSKRSLDRWTVSQRHRRAGLARQS